MANFNCMLCLIIMMKLVDGYINNIDETDLLTEENDHFRIKRQTLRGLSLSEKHQIVNTHNALRRSVKATDMTYMVWNENLSRLAQSWSDRCRWNHNPDRSDEQNEFEYIGENMQVESAPLNMDKVVRSWYSEKSSYVYGTGYCYNVCGHYTQVVWSESNSVGCGMTFCKHITGLPAFRNGGYMFVCDYGPGGNMRGYQPYRQGGLPCSKCPKRMPYCIDGLCSAYRPLNISRPGDTTPDIGSSSRTTPLVALHLLVLIGYCVL